MCDFFQGAEAAHPVKWCDGDGHLGLVVVICHQVYQACELDMANESYLGSFSGLSHEAVLPIFYLDVLEYSTLSG